MDYAEKFNYWQTTVHPAKSQGEILALLEDFGAESMMVAQGTSNGRVAWLVRFAWEGASYRFTFTPLVCSLPGKVSSFGGNKRQHIKQANYQMGRIAVHFIKAILTAAKAQPDALFGFVELPEAGYHPGGMPVTAGELDISGMTSTLPELNLDTTRLLSAQNEEER